MVKNPRRQHIVPKFLVREFCDESGMVFSARAGSADVVRLRPENIFVERDVYTHASSGLDIYRLESTYSELETQAAEILKNITSSVLNGLVPEISVPARRLVSLFLYQQMRRVPQHFRRLASPSLVLESVTESLAEYKALRPDNQPPSDDIFLSPLFLAQTRQKAIVDTLLQVNSRHVDIINSRGIRFIKIDETNCSFAITDHPTLRLASPHSTRLDDPEVEIWAPISSKVAILSYGRSDCPFVMDLNKPLVRRINENMCRQSSVVASCSRELTRSLSRFLSQPSLDRRI